MRRSAVWLRGSRNSSFEGMSSIWPVAVVIGAAFTAIVNVLVSALINPLIGLFFAADSLDTALQVMVPTLAGGTSTFSFGAIRLFTDEGVVEV